MAKNFFDCYSSSCRQKLPIKKGEAKCAACGGINGQLLSLDEVMTMHQAASEYQDEVSFKKDDD